MFGPIVKAAIRSNDHWLADAVPLVAGLVDRARIAVSEPGAPRPFGCMRVIAK
jgi:hypothetical protein